MNVAVGYTKNNFFLNDPQWAVDFAPNGIILSALSKECLTLMFT
jgi:hypothetical protein